MAENESLENLILRKEKFQGQLQKVTKEMESISDTFQSLRNELNDINKKLNQYKVSMKKNITVSDHAVLRFIERSGQFVTIDGEQINIDNIRQSLITPEIRRCHDVLGGGMYPLENTKVSVVIKENTIVTVTVR